MAARLSLTLLRSVASIAVAALLGSVVVAFEPLVAPAAAQPQVVASAADPIPLPSSITLTSDRTEIAAGQVATLVATTDVTVTGTGTPITIVDQTTGVTLKTCTTGTSCSVTNGFQTGGAHTYVATVGAMTSTAVMVSRTPWTVTLATSTSVFASNTAVTLTATASQSVSSTSSSYRIYVFDRTLGTLLKSCTTGSTCALTTTPPFLSGGAHDYVAMVAASGTPTYATVSDVQATSNEVNLSRMSWSTTLVADKAEYSTGQTVTLTSTANQPIPASGAVYRHYIFDATTGASVKSCTSGSTCSISSLSLLAPGTPHEYVSVVAAIGATTLATATDIQATSNPVTVARKAWAVTLVTDTEVLVAGDYFRLTASTNQTLTSSGYGAYVFDMVTGAKVATCLTTSSCESNGIRFSEGGPRPYKAFVLPVGAYATLADALGTIAESNEVLVTRKPWTLSLTVDNPVFSASETPDLTATANQRLAGSNYQLYIFDTTSGALLSHETSSSLETVHGNFETGGPHTYIAVIGQHPTFSPANVADVMNVQAVSNEVSAARLPWEADIRSSPWYYGRIQVTGWGKQETGHSVYSSYIVDLTERKVVGTENYLGGNSIKVDGNDGHLYATYIALRSDETWPLTDIQAVSGTLLARASGAGLPNEGTGGSNPSEPDCTCDHVDPIDSSSGEFYLPEVDLAIAGIGPELSISRTYSTQKITADSPFGYGWSSNFGMRLDVLIEGDSVDPRPRQVQITQENGSTVVFSQGFENSYLAADRVMATLALDDVSGTWTFTRKASEVFTFDAAGVIAAAADIHGNTVSFGHDGAGLVTSVTGSGGRVLTFTWTGAHITQAADSAGRTVSYGYSAAGDLTSVTAADGKVTTYSYAASHLMLQFTRPGGATTTNTYDTTSAKRVLTQTDPIGRVTTFSYSGGTTTITSPEGHKTVDTYVNKRLTSQTRGATTAIAATTTSTYDAAGNVTSSTDALGNVSTFTYDTDGNMLTSTDPLGRVSSWTYNQWRKPLTSTDPLGNVTTMTYDAAGNLLTATSPSGTLQWTSNTDGTVSSFEDASGGVTTYGYNAAGLLTSSTDPDGRTTSLAYSPAGFVTSQMQPGGATTTIETDVVGRILSTTNAASETTNYDYNSAGELISATAPNGDVVLTAYNLAGEVTSSTDASGQITLFTYTPSGQLATVKDANDHITTNAYNALGQLVSVTDPLGRITHYGYDGAGRPASATLPSGAVTSVVYDDAGQVLTSVDANGDESHLTYNSAGQPLTSTDPLGRVTAIRYNTSGLPDRVTLPDGSTQLSEYTLNGQLSTLTNPDGKETTYVYSAGGLLASKVEPGGLATSYSYDAAGRIQVATLPDGSTTTLTYSARGQVERVHYSDPTATDTTYTHDSLGRVTSMSDATGTTTYAYDAAGRLVSEQNGAGDTVGYGFDDVGQLTTVIYPGGDQVDYTYDAAGQMASLTDWSDETTTFTWTPDGQLLDQVLPNGLTEQRSYDPVGQLTGIETSRATVALADFGYAYDAAGQLTSTTTVLDGTSVSNDYGFDELSQLTSVTATPGGGTATTSALAATSAGLLTGTQSGVELAYNAAQQVVTATLAAGPVTAFAYDAKGSRVTSTTAAANMLPQLVTAYEYSASGALEAVTTPSATVAYTSDGRGLRQSRTVGATTKAFTWSTLGGLPLLLDDGDHRYIYGPSSTPLAQVDGSGVTEYLSTDMLGTPRLITDEDGDVGATVSFDAFGALATQTGTAVTRFGFTGNWTDPDTGLLYLRARDYDPTTGQFLSVDPAVDSTQQPYAYTGNNPVQRTDPTGLDWWSEAGDNILAAGAGALSNLTMGASDAILGAMVPGYDCFISEHSDAYGIGDLMVTIVSVALIVVPGVGLAAAGMLLAKTAIKEAVKAGFKQTVRTGGAAARNTLRAVTNGISRTADDVPTVVFSRTKAPGIASNFDNAVASGAPTQLTRASTRAADANRRAALSGQTKAPAGQSLDEYPFASSQQGGAGSFVRAVNVREQNYQGGVLSAFYQKFGIKVGDSFKVVFER